MPPIPPVSGSPSSFRADDVAYQSAAATSQPEERESRSANVRVAETPTVRGPSPIQVEYLQKTQAAKAPCIASDKPPVRVVHPRDRDQLIQDLLANIKNNVDVIDPLPPPDEAHIHQADWQEPKRTQEALWNNRRRSALHVTSSAARARPDVTLAYYVDDKPVGLMLMQRGAYKEPAFIQDIVTHPLSQGIGACLIEQAVEQSMQWGTKGKLRLGSLGGDSTKAYQAFGFVSTNGQYDYSEAMTLFLDPATSDKWRMNDGRWQLQNADTGKRYVSSLEANLKDKTQDIVRT